MNSHRNRTHPQALPIKLRFLSPPLLSASVAVFLYAVTLAGTYVYDDRQIILDDPRVHDPHLWIQLWTKDYFNGGIDNLYRPLVSTSYALEWFIHGDRPWIFHAINILLHALACAGVAEFTRRCLVGYRNASSAALCAGLLFAVHPVHVEAVANIVGRAELACTAAIFSALVILARRPLTLGRSFAALTCAIIALLCKEQGLLQPFFWVIFGLLIWKHIYPTPQPRERTAGRVLIVLLCWVWAIYMIGREQLLKFDWDRSFLDANQQPLVLATGADRVLMPIVLLGHYTALLVWPRHLSPDYGAEVIGHLARFNDPYLWIGFSSLMIFCVATIWAFVTRHRFALFCLLALAISYGMIGNIITLIGTIFAERLLYLPSAFFLILVGSLLASFPVRIRNTLLALILSLCCIRSFTAARDWNHPLNLFQDAIDTHPKSLQLRLLLAQEYHLQGNESAAQDVMTQAAQALPGYWQVWIARANHAMDANHLQDAQQYLAIARKLNVSPQLMEAQERLSKLQSQTTPTTYPKLPDLFDGPTE